MVARENWELLEDAKCYFRILLRGLFSLPHLLQRFHFSSCKRQRNAPYHPTGDGPEPNFELANLIQAASWSQRRVRDMQRKKELFTFSKAFHPPIRSSPEPLWNLVAGFGSGGGVGQGCK